MEAMPIYSTNCHIQKVKSHLAQTEEERGHPPQQTLTHLTPTLTHTQIEIRNVACIQGSNGFIVQKLPWLSLNVHILNGLIRTHRDTGRAFVIVSSKQPGCSSPQQTAKHVTFLKNNDSVHKSSLEAAQRRCLFRQVMSSKQKPLHRALPRTCMRVERPLGERALS